MTTLMPIEMREEHMHINAKTTPNVSNPYIKWRRFGVFPLPSPLLTASNSFKASKLPPPSNSLLL
eukprot:CAMPEP_0118662288 /NCGR_PEP_ID=MMETSP0785-20121206/16749_1 /TAXON_ID=91992 /ORGANISM="Bolidomonas pacifica, Strain CCMP 1866" /LENGTH=64 /DNA_ID=CAMNT_0006555817 /DNA_START=63 /DNA_END=253 /DNA_ORIENTATION=-